MPRTFNGPNPAFIGVLILLLLLSSPKIHFVFGKKISTQVWSTNEGGRMCKYNKNIEFKLQQLLLLSLSWGWISCLFLKYFLHNFTIWLKLYCIYLSNSQQNHYYSVLILIKIIHWANFVKLPKQKEKWSGSDFSPPV